MLFIYIDETFNLKKGTKNQFLAIAGYSTQNPRELTKVLYRIKKTKLPKNLISHEIKSNNPLADKTIKPHLFKALLKTDIKIYCNLIFKSNLDRTYFHKGNLNYDQLYFDLVLDLLTKITSKSNDNTVNITLDAFKTKRINKNLLLKQLGCQLKIKFPKKIFKIIFEDSAGNYNLQIADYICGLFFEKLNGDSFWYDLIEPKIASVIENPFRTKKREVNLANRTPPLIESHFASSQGGAD